MKKSVRNSRIYAPKILILLLCLLFSFFVNGAPLVIKSVDGTYLKMLAVNWTEKGDGVLLEIAKGVNLVKLRNKLNELFPYLNVEITEEGLFFPNTTEKALFETIKGAETGFDTVKESLLSEKTELFTKSSVSKTSPKEEYLEGNVEKVVFEEEEGKIEIAVKITKKSKSGKFTKLSGRYKIEVVYKKRDGKIDTKNGENIFFAPLMFLKAGDKLSFLPIKNEAKVLTISDFIMK